MRKGDVSSVWRKYFIVILFGLVLTGCDDNKSGLNHEPTLAKEVQPSSSERSSSQTKAIQYDKAGLDALAKRYAGKKLTLLDASVIQLDGASTLVLSFSTPLMPDSDYASFLTVVDKKFGRLDGGWELADNLMELRLRHLKPNRALILTVDEGISAINGEYLTLENSAKSQSIDLVTPDITPSVGFASKGSLLPTKLVAGLPVLALNVNSVDIDFFRIKPGSIPSFLSKWSGRNFFFIWDADDFTKSADLVYSGRFDLNPQRNTRENIQLPLKEIKPLQEPGVYLAVMRQTGSYSNNTIPATLFTLSDIGISIHIYHDNIDVFTQALEGGAALANVEISLLDEKGASLDRAKTDTDGHAKLKKFSKGKVLIARQNQQISLIALNQPALDLSEFDIAGPKGYATQFFTFGPRDLYRPGETLIVNGLLRDADGNKLADQPIKVDILKPDHQVVRSFVWQPENGLYQYSYSIPASAATGQWLLRMNLGDNQPRFYSFKVEDFLPERLALEIKASAKQVLAPDDTVNFAVSGRYLYGAPAAGNQLIGQVFLRPNRSAVAKLPGFEFGSVTEGQLSQTLVALDQIMDQEGKDFISVDSIWQSSKSPLSVIIQASLLESGGRPVTRSAEQAIWPAQVLPGVRPLFSREKMYDYDTNLYETHAVVDENSIAEFEIVYADIDGKKHATGQDLIVRLIRERRDYYWRWSDSEGWRSEYNQKDLVLETMPISLADNGSYKASFSVEWGAYRIEVLDPTTEVVSSYRFWAGYRWQDNTNGSGAVRPDQVKLKLDKAAYQVGDKMKLHVEAPAAGKGYLMVESSDGPLWWQEIEVPVGGAEFDIPLNKEWRRHDIYLSALVIRPGDKKLQLTPKRAVGLLHLPLADDNRKLDIQLEAPQKMEPNETLTIKVKVQSKNAKPLDKINVLVSAVDVGILNITNFTTPDPYQSFLGRKRYSVDQFDVYGQLIDGHGKLASLRFGGDGGDGDDEEIKRGGKKAVTSATIVALQSLPITVNAQGEGEIQLAIPDFNGELRLMAQAWSNDEFGNTESKITVAAPLIMELATPRFIAGGDVSRLALDLNNLSGAWQNIKLSVSVDGLVGFNNNSGTIEQNVTLDQGQKTTVYIPVYGLPGFGQGEIKASVSGLQLPNKTAKVYQRSWKIGVRPALPAETRNFASLLRTGDSWSLPDNALQGLVRSTVEAKLLLTSRPPLNLAQNIQELYAYPYGCSEQTTSGLFPSLYTNSAQLKALGIKTSTDEARRESIEVGIERLLAMQRYNGSFGLWSKQSEEEFWGTVYITDFLYRARELGYYVAENALNQATERLQGYLQDSNQIGINYSARPEHTRFAVQAYAGLVLARQRKAPLGALRQIYERRKDAQSGLPLVQLGVALQLMGDVDRAKTAINDGLGWQDNANTLWLGDYGSPIRDSALILSLMYEYDLQPPERDRRLLALSDDLVGQTYLSTQERNSVFLAGRFMLDTKEQRWSAKVVGSTTQQISQVAAKTLVLPIEQISNGLTLVSTSETTLYPRLNITGYPARAPSPMSNNLTIRRQFLRADGNEVALNSVKSGDLIFVHLTIKAENATVPDALVVDLLPAGLELENQNLGNSSASLNQVAGALMPLMIRMQQANIQHQEFRDDRYVAAINVDYNDSVDLVYLARAVTPGSYSIPAPMVESMYRPYIRAIGSTPARIIIK